MTWSAPIERTSSTLRVLVTPVTSAPNALAICTAKVPTPPDAPLIRTFWPAVTRAESRSSWRAVVADTPTAAACSKLRRAGFGRNWSSGARANSAKAPAHQPNTSSPGRRRWTSLPTASTVPATSVPGIGCFGRRRPVASRMRYGDPVIRIQSPTWMDAAWTRTRTSSSPMAGRIDVADLEGRCAAVAVLRDGLHRNGLPSTRRCCCVRCTLCTAYATCVRCTRQAQDHRGRRAPRWRTESSR